MTRLSVVVPCFNEAATVGATTVRLLEALPGVEPGFEIVLCDDGSTDGTGALLEALANRHPGAVRAKGYARNRGAGHAFRTALAASAGRLVVHMDADLAMDPAAACRACLAGLAGHDLVFCSRYAGAAAAYPLRRRLPSLAYRALYRGLLGIGVGDAMSGFFGLRREALDRLPPLESDGFEIYLELLVKARRAGLRVAEAPVPFVHRAGPREFSVLRDGPGQVLRTLRVWRRFA